MKNLGFVLGALMLPSMMGCAYGGVAAADGKAIVSQNTVLWGLLRKVYVCDVTDSGLSDCQSSQNP